MSLAKSGVCSDDVCVLFSYFALRRTCVVFVRFLILDVVYDSELRLVSLKSLQ